MSVSKIVMVGFLQALALVLYCTAIGVVMINGERWLGRPDPFLALPFFLMLFVFSALVSASAVLGYPLYLIWKGQMGKGLKILGSTVAWVGLFLGGALGFCSEGADILITHSPVAQR